MITKKEFNGNIISFGKRDDNGEIMVNATEMAKSFGKRPNDWCNLPSTKEFLDVLSNTRKSGNSDNQLVITRSGSPENGGGTWMHEDVALEFARWLSPAFAIWCNDRIKELLTVGITAKEDVIDMIINDPDMGIALLTKLKEERAKRKEAEGTVAILTHTNKTYTATEIAKELGFKSAIEFNKALAERGIQFKQNNTWVPYADYSQNGWFEIKQEVLDNGHIIYHRRITGLGRKAFNQMFNEI